MALFNRVSNQVFRLKSQRNLSTAAQVAQIQDEIPQSFRTKEINPTKHTLEHLNRFYTVPSEEAKSLYCYGVPKRYKIQIKTFAEMAILIRKPAIEVLNYLTQTDFTKPVNKYVLYGEYGTGKTLTMLHLMHYGYCTKKIIVHVNWPQHWYRFPKEVADANSQKGKFDLPIDAAAWLLNFKNQNMSVLSEADLKLSKNYEWDDKESSQKTSSLMTMIDFGISRVKYACDIVNALMDELKQASTAGKCKVLVAIDGFNAFYSNHTQIKNDQRQFVGTDQITLTNAFLNITKSDWCNGQIILALDQCATKDRRDSHLPRYLLSKEGFDHLDPFLPVGLDNYTTDEFETVVEYYKNRKWIRHLTPEGQKELKLLSGGNPFKLMDYCKHL